MNQVLWEKFFDRGFDSLQYVVRDLVAFRMDRCAVEWAIAAMDSQEPGRLDKRCIAKPTDLFQFFAILELAIGLPIFDHTSRRQCVEPGDIFQ